MTSRDFDAEEESHFWGGEDVENSSESDDLDDGLDSESSDSESSDSDSEAESHSSKASDTLENRRDTARKLATKAKKDGYVDLEPLPALHGLCLSAFEKATS